jgi:hypothetical protein
VAGALGVRASRRKAKAGVPILEGRLHIPEALCTATEADLDGMEAGDLITPPLPPGAHGAERTCAGGGQGLEDNGTPGLVCRRWVEAGLDRLLPAGQLLGEDLLELVGVEGVWTPPQDTLDGRAGRGREREDTPERKVVASNIVDSRPMLNVGSNVRARDDEVRA